MIIEICLDSPESAKVAQEYGAQRVELCANLLEGGTTPSAGCIVATRKAIDIGLFVIIRPRGGDFYYNESEIEQMKYNVQLCKHIGADGVVIGLLNQDGSIDAKHTKELIEIARPMEVTFHRAFDRCKNPISALDVLIELGVDRILTSGQQLKAIDGRVLIGELVKKAQGRIVIMPGSGINASNILQLAKETKVTEFHFTASKKAPNNLGYKHPSFSEEEYIKSVFDIEKLLNSKTILEEI